MSLKLISNGLSLNKHQDIISPWPFFLVSEALLAAVPLWPELRPHAHSNEYANNFLRHTHIPGTPLPRLADVGGAPPTPLPRLAEKTRGGVGRTGEGEEIMQNRAAVLR